MTYINLASISKVADDGEEITISLNDCSYADEVKIVGGEAESFRDFFDSIAMALPFRKTVTRPEREEVEVPENVTGPGDVRVRVGGYRKNDFGGYSRGQRGVDLDTGNPELESGTIPAMEREENTPPGGVHYLSSRRRQEH